MNPDTLTEVACCRMADLSEQASSLTLQGLTAEAKVLAEEISLIARALDNNDPFLVIC